jgi:hypothetical protein
MRAVSYLGGKARRTEGRRNRNEAFGLGEDLAAQLLGS